MRYGFAETLADYGFSFLEKLHQPIFLIDRRGTIKKVNEAGRKLMKIASLSASQVHELTRGLLSTELQAKSIEYRRVSTGHKDIKICFHRLQSTDDVLVELHH